jgi:hypothetical protein
MLTEVDRRLLAYLESLYGPPQGTAASDASRPAPVVPVRRTVGLLIRTMLLLGAAVLLVTGTDPGRMMYGGIIDQLALIHTAVVDLLR